MYTSIKINNYKCFVADNEPQGFDFIKPINVIIGKNNSGKSKLLEVLGEIVTKNPEELPFNGIFQKQLEKDELLKIFRADAYSQELNIQAGKSASEWDIIGRYLVGKVVYYTLQNNQIKATHISRDILQLSNNPFIINYIQDGIGKIPFLNPFRGYQFLHLQAERDIGKEAIAYHADISKTSIKNNATGVCSLISRMLNDESGNNEHWQEYIEKDFLHLINNIVAPEIKFTRIYTKTNSSNFHEIYLEEENKGGIKLSDCGSGLKTIIATLTLLHIVPHLTGNSKNVFALEELENNLHPSLERKLLKHIWHYSDRHHDAIIFLTTHSNVALDMFGKDYRSQIIRVCNDGHKSTVETVISNNDKQILLDDLDRIYIKKWIELFSDGKLEEGLQYQFICYGGALLAHYTANNQKDLISLLKINRNSYVIMDSDKNSEDAKLKNRVARISKELPKSHWITKGKEIENYIPVEVLKDYFGNDVDIQENNSVAEFYKENKGVQTFDKVSFALDVVRNKNYTKATLCKCLDLEQKINELIQFIEKSNASGC